MDSDKDLERWMGALSALASLCEFELTSDVIAVYDMALSEHGYDNLAKATQHLMIERESHHKFPSIKDFHRTLNFAGGSPENEASRIAGHIIELISKKGRTWAMRDHTGTFGGHESFAEAVEAELGAVGYEVVKRMGGWMALCESTQARYISVLQKQLTEIAKGILDAKKFGSIKQIDAPSKKNYFRLQESFA